MPLYQVLTIIIALAVALLGSGIVSKIVGRATRDTLSEDFTKKSDFDRLDNQVHAMAETITRLLPAMQADIRSVAEQSDRLENEQQRHSERMVTTLDNITERLERLGELQARTSAILEILLQKNA